MELAATGRLNVEAIFLNRGRQFKCFEAFAQGSFTCLLEEEVGRV